MKDNWALLHACEQAAKTGAPVAICFNLVRLRPALQCYPSTAFVVKPGTDKPGTDNQCKLFLCLALQVAQAWA